MTNVYFDGRGYGFAQNHSAELDKHNRELSEREVAAFKAGVGVNGYFAYWREHDGQRSIGTWTGDQLATVTWASRPYRVPAFGFPSTRVNFRALGIDGREYAGTYYSSSGSYVRMRAVKPRGKGHAVTH